MTTIPLATEAKPHNQAVLTDLVDLGHRLARLVVEQAEAGLNPAVEATKGFERTTRDIRRCVWLSHILDKPAKTIDRTAARKHIIRTVEDAIQRETDPLESEGLHEELMDRLDTLDLEDEIATRPIEDIIADIIHDLGLAASALTNPPWKRRTPEDVAELSARAAQPPAAAVPQRHSVGCNSS